MNIMEFSPEDTSTERLIKSLYAHMQYEFKKIHEEIGGMENRLSVRLDKIEGYVSGHEGRISGLEESMKVVKTKLGLA